MTESVDTLIIGGGLSGIYSAYLLSQTNQSIAVLEARARLGGRIYGPEHQGGSFDLGPTWYWPAIQPKIANLIEALGLAGFPQYETGMGRFQQFNGAVRTVGGFETQPVSWRLSGGMMVLLEKLCEHIPENVIRLNHPVYQIERNQTGAVVSVGKLGNAAKCQFKARNVILALPPRLAAFTILFTPDLSHHLSQAMLKIGTWMAGQAKFYAIYDAPFWRKTGLSGQAFSECGPLSEIYDGSFTNDGPFGLTGFVGVPAVQRSQKRYLIEAIIAQLAVIFGEQATQPANFFYHDWARERFTATQYDQRPMSEHPRYAPPEGHISFWDGTVLFAGTETAIEHGGYLEGALGAAEQALRHI